MESLIGQTVGNYQILRLLGRGGFAEVYLGKHINLNTFAAIKVLDSYLSDKDAEDFLTEARTVAHLIHPNIIRIFDFMVHNGRPFIIMDYAPNGTLRQRHRGVTAALPIIVDYTKQIASALQYAHNHNLIHRDVKPDNMLIGRNSEILLSDFGTALIARSMRTQLTKEIVGTIFYMAPEQFQGKAGQASDQYALAVCVYEWLSGNRPFVGSFTEVASQHMYAPPPSLREKDASISPAIEQVVMTALSKDPHKRFGSVGAFANALELAYLSQGDVNVGAKPPQQNPITPLPPIAPNPVIPAPEYQIHASQEPRASTPTPPSQTLPYPAPGVNTPELSQSMLVTEAGTFVSPGVPVPTPPSAPLAGTSVPLTPTSFPAPTPFPAVEATPLPNLPFQQPFSALSNPALPAVPRPPFPPSSQPTGNQKPGEKRRITRRGILLALLAFLLIATTITGYAIVRTKTIMSFNPTPTPIPWNGIGITNVGGESIGLSDGSYTFDANRPDGSLKTQGSEQFKLKNTAQAIQLWQEAVAKESDDAEALIYLEDQRVVASRHPYVTIVVSTLLTGAFVKSVGRLTLQGAYVLQKEYNDGSKLPDGVQIRLLIANTGDETVDSVARQIVQAARADKTIVGVMGWPFGGSSKTATQILSAAHIPLVSPTAPDDFLTAISPYFFRVTPSEMWQATVAANYMQQTWGVSKAAVFFDPQDSYSKNLAGDFIQAFQAEGNSIVARENYTAGQDNAIPGLLQDALRANPDTIYFAGDTSDIITLVQDLPTSGPFAQLQVMGGDGLYIYYPGSEQPNFRRLHFTAFAFPDSWNILKLTAQEPPFYAEYGPDLFPSTATSPQDISSNVLFSYDAMLSLATACKLALASGKNQLLPSDVQQGLKKITTNNAIQGTTGQIAFGSSGDPVNKAVFILRVDAEGDIVLEAVRGAFVASS